MRTVHTIKELRAVIRSYRNQGKRVGLVPTMGNLHEGHLALIRRAREASDVVVTSIFVNPMQFGAGEDLEAYPRTLAEDQRKLEQEGNALLFAPTVREIYSAGLALQTQVVVPEVSEGHCGASRPGHFTGVATVVTMLFNMVQPDVAVFGEKDYQQLAVIRKMTRDLFMPVDVIGLPTIREADGLAMSSRNGYLSADERRKAPAIHRVMTETGAALAGGSDDFAGLEASARENLATEGFRPDYFNIVNSFTLKPAEPGDRELTILAAAFLGTTRLIDNLSIVR
ncbi:pantothenate synthetase [Marinobacter daqiaonensis]|uniref:Pantothenate synthetase n=1 Tax=Marinobacter daqiaonensis TaxID=650891 RepID=A0A1I6JW38_9GAMM|nr:pantoate--beta-alanine ligase [Marinobacter daqiaonensis]SFR83192.1 pantothenate synthetase [Marinobacter daqiaonensis]